MKLLLDTCRMIWAISKPESLSRTAADMLQEESAQIWVSSISAAEIACASERGKIVLDRPWKDWFRHYVELNGWGIEVIDLDIIIEAYSLPEGFHADPADRIVASCGNRKTARVYAADGRSKNPRLSPCRGIVVIDGNASSPPLPQNISKPN